MAKRDFSKHNDTVDMFELGQIDTARIEQPHNVYSAHELPFEGKPTNTRLHGAVWKSLGFFFFGILGAFALAFRNSPQTLFMLAICGVYLSFYLGGPLLFMGVTNQKLDIKMPLAEFLKRPFATYTGKITGLEAWMQICIIPGALFITAAGMSLLISLTA